jgi:hypothetical protein
MLRRIALTFIPSVALYSVAACLITLPAPRAASLMPRTAVPGTTAVPHYAARSGYIVASS